MLSGRKFYENNYTFYHPTHIPKQEKTTPTYSRRSQMVSNHDWEGIQEYLMLVTMFCSLSQVKIIWVNQFMGIHQHKQLEYFQFFKKFMLLNWLKHLKIPMQRPHCRTIKSESLGNETLILVVLKVPQMLLMHGHVWKPRFSVFLYVNSGSLTATVWLVTEEMRSSWLSCVCFALPGWGTSMHLPQTSVSTTVVAGTMSPASRGYCED